LRFAELLGRLIEVCGELADGSHVGLADALGETGELEVLKELAAKRTHGLLLSENSERGFQKSHRHSRCAGLGNMCQLMMNWEGFSLSPDYSSLESGLAGIPSRRK
jgi:hypothetical protein